MFDVWGLNYYADPVGSSRFLLDVRNVDDFHVEDIKATVLLQDAAGQIVSSQSGYARLNALKRGDTAPVLVVFFLQAPAFATYEVEVQGRKADHLAELLHPDLQIVDYVGRVGECVPYEVLGRADKQRNRACGVCRAAGALLRCLWKGDSGWHGPPHRDDDTTRRLF